MHLMLHRFSKWKKASPPSFVSSKLHQTRWTQSLKFFSSTPPLVPICFPLCLLDSKFHTAIGPSFSQSIMLLRPRLLPSYNTGGRSRSETSCPDELPPEQWSKPERDELPPEQWPQPERDELPPEQWL